MIKVFKYRIYGNKSTILAAEQWLETCRTLYNLCLEQKISAYKNHRKYVSWYQQCRELTELKKEFPQFAINRCVLENVIKRLDRAYQGFFTRIKVGDAPGFPRFKGKYRYDSFTFRVKGCGYKVNGKYLVIKKIGKFKIKLSRPIEGNIQEVTLKRSAGNKWFVMFTCKDVQPKIIPSTNKTIGIDVGCESFITDSKGTKIDNPRFFKSSQDKLAQAQKELARKKKGSNRRQKSKIRVAKIYEKISNQRKDFHCKTANQLLKKNDIIFIEKLKVWNSYKALNRSMRDVAWFNFFNILKCKAEEAGKRVIEVPAKNTSQMCSNCGQIVPKDLSVRVHSCPCGLVIDRDFNSALNILKLGQSLQSVSSKTTVDLRK